MYKIQEKVVLPSGRNGLIKLIDKKPKNSIFISKSLKIPQVSSSANNIMIYYC